MPGSLLLRIARGLCSPGRCAGVLEPLIADLQYELRSAHGIDRLRRLGSGYCAFWSTFAACAARDVLAPESLRFLGRAAAAFSLIVGASFALEWLLVGANDVMRHNAAVVFRIPYVGWYARFQSATLMFVVPMAIVPALRYAIRLGSPAACATRVAAVVFGLILVTVASGWVAPALERMKTRRMWDDFAAQTHGRYYMEPIDVVFDRSSTAKNLPGLIRAALSPPAHRFPGYPNYVAPEDRFAQLGYWRDLKFRGLLLMIAAFMSTFALRSEPRTP